ncbi:hypothetical protein V2I93_23140, partial [Pseudomonas viridiflava]|nr:hypothetical protein [Pseudomonas viridiflava]
SSVTDRSLQKKHRRQAASHSPWSQQYSGITLSTGMGMIGVPEITLIVPHAMGTISVEADLCITMSAEHGNDQIVMLIVPTLCVTFSRLAQVVQQFMRRVAIGGPAE